MEDDEMTIDEDWLDELEYLAYESPRSHVEIFRTDLIQLVSLAREALNARIREQDEMQ